MSKPSYRKRRVKLNLNLKIGDIRHYRKKEGPEFDWQKCTVEYISEPEGLISFVRDDKTNELIRIKSELLWDGRNLL